MKYISNTKAIFDAVQVTQEMMDSQEFPAGVTIRRVNNESYPVTREFIQERMTNVLVHVGDWILTNPKGWHSCVTNDNFNYYFKPYNQ